MIPDPTRLGRMIPGKMRLRPITVWAPVGPDEFCRHWELRDGAPVSAIPRLGEPTLEPGDDLALGAG